MREYHSYYFDSMGADPVFDAFSIDPGTEMTEGFLKRLIDEFREEYVPRYKYLRMPWERKFEIFGRPPKPDWKPDNRLSANFARSVTKTFEGYYIGNPVTLSIGDEAKAAWLADYARRVDQADVDADISNGCSCYGNAFELLYQDASGLPSTTYVDPMRAFVVYDSTVQRKPMFGVIVSFDEQGKLFGEWYDDVRRVKYRDGGETIVFEEIEPHYFGGVPLIEYVQDSNREGLYEGVMNLIDAFNRCISEKANDVEYFADAYMLVIGSELPDDFKEDLQKMRLINLWGDAGIDVRFIQKPDSDVTQEHLLNRLETLVYKNSMVPDITDDSFYTASGEALEKRLLPMSNMAKTKDRKFTASVRRRLRLLCNYPNQPFTGDDWVSVEIQMHRNEPKNVQAEASVAASLSGVVSRETQLKMLSFVDDPRAEMVRLDEERQAAAAISTDNYATAREPTMYEITSILGKYKRGSLKRANALKMLVKIGVDEIEATELLDDV